METRRIIAYLLVLAVVATLVAVRILTVRSRRRERRQAARPIDIVADTHER
jgi:DMSO/TMAO reductase YedYZ heme-binding membrane subunit